MTVHIPDAWQRFIQGEIRSGRYQTADEVLEAALRLLEARDRVESPESPLSTAPATDRPVWEVIAELAAEVPDEEFAKLPPDGAEQHDHYLYGVPKRPS